MNCKKCSIEKIQQEIAKCEFACDDGTLESHRGYMALLARAKQLQAELDKTKEYAGRLFKSLAPQCELLPDLLGILTQIDNWSTQHRWIPVSERLPLLKGVGNEDCTQSTWVHITDGERVIDAYYYDYTKREAKPNYATGKGWYCHGMRKSSITHWKPVILPPKDATGGKEDTKP